jgi:hypothetical protein
MSEASPCPSDYRHNVVVNLMILLRKPTSQVRVPHGRHCTTSKATDASRMRYVPSWIINDCVWY